MSATHPRRAHRGPQHGLLPALATVVDQATLDTDDHVMVRIAGPVHPEVELAFRTMDPGSHPFEVLAGFSAPEDWSVFGIRTHGRARHLDDPAAPAREVASTFVVDRHGREASVLRFDDEVIDAPGPAEGTIPDLCRRVLGVPTAPPPPTTALLWACVWVDRILERWGQPERRRDLLKSWGQIAILHPAVHAPSPPDLLAVADPRSLAAVARPHAEATTWEALRTAAEPMALPDGPLPHSIARWMDDGFFARWAIGAYPSPHATAMTLRDLLGDPLGPQLLEALALLVERDT